MFESDDFDQVLSQLDFPDEVSKSQPRAVDRSSNENSAAILSLTSIFSHSDFNSRKDVTVINTQMSTHAKPKADNLLSPINKKRKLINSHFDHKSKRKFPGPAGLLTGSIEETNDEAINHLQLLSQDIDFSQSHLQRDIFESPLWSRLLSDVKQWNLGDVNSIRTIKQQALAGNLQRRKAQTVIAFVESVDRSAIDPLIKLRDITGNIKCTLHRDAWSTFSHYIASDYCALVLWKPTVLTTGATFKKHYLNITLSNIFAMYCSTVVNDEEVTLPDHYVKECKDGFTIIKTEEHPQNFGINENRDVSMNGADNLLDGLDGIFTEEQF